MGEALHVFVRGLRLAGRIGVHAHEQGRSQPLSIDVELALAPRPVRRLADTVDYARLAGFAREILAAGHVDLVEDLALRLARRCLALEGVLSVRVRVEKPEALDEADAAGAEVRLSAGTGGPGGTFGGA